MKLHLLGFGLLTIVVVAANRPAAGDDRKDDKPFDDKEFVQHTASGGIHEVKLGEVAQSKATSDLVKKFGERMVKDHTKANEELTTVAKGMLLTVAEKMSEKDQQEFDKFAALSGAEFDKSYMEHMVKDHEKDVKMFQRASREAKNPQLKEFATKTLPTLEEHLKMAKEIQKQVSK